VRKTLLRVEHHLLISPLSELGVARVKKRDLLGYLSLMRMCQLRMERVRLLLRMVILIEGRIEGLGGDGRCPTAWRLLYWVWIGLLRERQRQWLGAGWVVICWRRTLARY
jgi:hypothetical protein